MTKTKTIKTSRKKVTTKTSRLKEPVVTQYVRLGTLAVSGVVAEIDDMTLHTLHLSYDHLHHAAKFI